LACDVGSRAERQVYLNAKRRCDIVGDKSEVVGDDFSFGIYCFNGSGEFKASHTLIKYPFSAICTTIQEIKRIVYEGPHQKGS
jgi:hypothetical protein